MKILQVISSLGNGGAEKFVVELSNELSNNNEVLLCSFKKTEEWMIFPKLLKKEVKLISFGKKAGFTFNIYRNIYALLKAEKPDVVHFHLDATIKYILPFAFLFQKIKFIHTLHSNLNTEKKERFYYLNKFPFLVKRIKLVCISPYILKEFEEHFKNLNFHLCENGITQLKTTDLLNNVQEEIKTMKLNDQTLVFISVGRLDENKNQELSIKAFDTFKDLNFIYLIIGSDPLENQDYLNKLLKLKSDKIFFLGSKKNIQDYLFCSDAFVMASLEEGLPISALEAFSIGLPVITTPTGGLQDMVVNNFNGFISKDFSFKEFAGAIQSFTNLEEKRKIEIKKNNIETFLSNYNINVCTNKYLTLYNLN